MAKESKLKFRKFRDLIFTFGEVAGGKWYGEVFWFTPILNRPGINNLSGREINSGFN